MTKAKLRLLVVVPALAIEEQGRFSGTLTVVPIPIIDERSLYGFG